MSRHTTLKIGGPADAYVEARDTEMLVALVGWCLAESIPTTTVGGGSNLLVRDGGIRGVVISTRALRNLKRIGDTVVAVDAGVSTGKLLSSATKWELGGLEFLGGVPGSVGGGLVMNAGTYLGEFKMSQPASSRFGWRMARQSLERTKSVNLCIAARHCQKMKSCSVPRSRSRLAPLRESKRSSLDCVHVVKSENPRVRITPGQSSKTLRVTSRAD